MTSWSTTLRYVGTRLDIAKCLTNTPIANQTIRGYTGNELLVLGTGTVIIETDHGPLRLEQVKHIPDGLENLFSLRTAICRLGGREVTGWSEDLSGGRLTHNDEVVLTAKT